MLQPDLLPTHVKPTHYAISLRPDLEVFEYSGESVISLDIIDTTKTVVFNAKELNILSATINCDNVSQKASHIALDSKRQICTLTFDHELPAGQQAYLYLHYKGILNDQLSGFYRSSYRDLQGSTKYMATTHFEPSDARRAFPCWDEPALRATFEITLTVPQNLTAISNMPVAKEWALESETGWKEVKFAITPSMSTYLIAFAVGDLDFVEGKTTDTGSGSVLCRVYAHRGTGKFGQFALETSIKVLELYNNLFGIAYPLPKLDMLAVPDFNIGAMENWGLVTYRTAYLLYDPANSASVTMQKITSIVAHELAHQWFGNLVALDWWSQLWLKEGFATWVGTYAMDKLNSHWATWLQFVIDETGRALELDGLLSSHPIEVPVKDPAEIGQIFDAISYSKGASVIRMLFVHLGEQRFFDGLKIYLNKHSYGNASTNDLWDALSESSEFNVGEFMGNWTKKTGYPVLTVTESQEGTISVTQERYYYGKNSADKEDILWQVPLLWLGVHANHQRDVLSTRQATFQIPDVPIVKLNAKACGLYRVVYPTNMINQYATLIKNNDQNLSELDRINLLSDMAALSISGYQHTSVFLDFISNFENESGHLVLEEISLRLTTVFSIWFEESESTLSKLRTLRHRVFKNVFHRMGWEAHPGEDPMYSMLRSLAIKNMAASGDSSVIKEACHRFARYVAGFTEAINRDLRGAVYQIAIQNGGSEAYYQMKDIFKSTDLMDHKLTALAALGSPKEPNLIQDALEFALSSEVRSQDALTLLAAVARNPFGRRPAWAFVQAQWPELVKRSGENVSTLGNLVKATAGLLTTEADAKQIAHFFEKNPTGNIDRALSNTLERIHAHAAWLARDREDVETWLNKHITE